MLFNSFAFLLAFLPLALGLHWLAERFAPQWRLPVLAALSFAFYGYWDWRFVPLLAASILVNWLIAEHKSQGTMQLGVNRGDYEEFWWFDMNDRERFGETTTLFRRLAEPFFEELEY